MKHKADGKKKKERAENKETESKYEVSLKRKPKVGTLKGMIKTDKPLERLIKKKRQSTNHQHRGFLKGETTHLADKKDIMNHSSLTNWRVCSSQ